MSNAASHDRGNIQKGMYGALPRLVSLLLALGLSGWMFAAPMALAHAGHALLSLALLGVCAGFVHGVGFVPLARIWRIVFSPWLAWALMGLALWLMLGART
ncbi:MAG TPA: cyd operon YbgE family protein [Gallionellaceae bacterium]